MPYEFSEVGPPAGLTNDPDLREQVREVSGTADAPVVPQVAPADATTSVVELPDGGLPISWPGDPQDGD